MENNMYDVQNNEQGTLTLASIGKRFVAALIDGLIMIIPGLVLGWIPVAGPILALVIEWLYFAKMEELTGATLGKRWMKIQVVNADGQFQTFWQASLRYLIRNFISGILCIGYIVAFFTQNRQALHDLAAKTFVIEKKSDPLPTFDEFVDSTKKSFTGSSQKAKSNAAIEQIEKLKEMLDNGILTEEEFELKKKELLEKIK